jgi:phage terminase large subunit
MEWRVINYYANSQKKLHHYLQYLQELPYNYGETWLPHDAQSEQLGAEKTIEQQVRDNMKDVRIAPKLPIADGIEAVRNIFPLCIFDKEKCTDGLTSLRRYAYKKDPETGKVSKNPEHTIWSHGADAFRYFAVSHKEPVMDVIDQDFSEWEIG